jgi:hypothetical protein
VQIAFEATTGLQVGLFGSGAKCVFWRRMQRHSRIKSRFYWRLKSQRTQFAPEPSRLREFSARAPAGQILRSLRSWAGLAYGADGKSSPRPAGKFARNALRPSAWRRNSGMPEHDHHHDHGHEHHHGIWLRIPGAVNVPLAELTHCAPGLAVRKQPIVVVCKTDRRSAKAATALIAAGLRDAAVLRDGTDGWHRQSLALE